jgi:hypothetical protein
MKNKISALVLLGQIDMEKKIVFAIPIVFAMFDAHTLAYMFGYENGTGYTDDSPCFSDVPGPYVLKTTRGTTSVWKFPNRHSNR